MNELSWDDKIIPCVYYFEEIADMRLKIGRNDPCCCGSGKKFKKCCIDKYKTDDYSLSDGVKMSEIILDLIDEPLKHAQGKANIEHLVQLACFVWNISTLKQNHINNDNLFNEDIDDDEIEDQDVDSDEHDNQINEILSALPKDFAYILEKIQQIKQEKYSNVNRFIKDYNVTVRSTDDFHIQIQSFPITVEMAARIS